MKGRKIKNNDIKNFIKEYLEDKEEKKNYFLKPIMNRNKNRKYFKVSEDRNKQNKKSNNKTFEKKINNNENNLIIRSKQNENKLFRKSNTNLNSPKAYKNNINSIKKDLIKQYKLGINQPFVTSINFKNVQTNEEESKGNSTKYISKNNNLVNFGKSINEILINTINEAIMKKGNIIKKKKRKTFSANNIYHPKHKYENFNNYDLHMKIFDDKLIQMYEDYEKKHKLFKKQKLNNLSPDFEKIRQKAYSRIPLYIKGYNKNNIDIFYTRNICDLDYQKYYMKEKINMNDILENHNIYNRKDYLSTKIPFFMLTKSVVKPICKKSSSQKNILGNKLKEIYL